MRVRLLTVRVADGLMRLPKGRRRSRKPVEELHEVVDGGETSDVQFGAVGGRATLETGEVLIGEEGVGDEGISGCRRAQDSWLTFCTDERVQSKSTERDSEAVIGSFDGAVEQSAEYDGDVDEGKHSRHGFRHLRLLIGIRPGNLRAKYRSH